MYSVLFTIVPLTFSVGHVSRYFLLVIFKVYHRTRKELLLRIDVLRSLHVRYVMLCALALQMYSCNIGGR